MRLDEIDQSHVNAFVASQAHLSTKTVNNKLTVLSTMLRYAADIGVIAEPKLKCHIKSMSPDIVAVPIEDVARLVSATDDERMKVAVLLATEAGLRVGEIRGLQWTDVRGGQLTVRRAIDQQDNVTTPKHDKRRSVPLSPALDVALSSGSRRGIWVVASDDGSPMPYERLLDAIDSLYVAAELDVPKSETGVTMP
jgi:integrase